MSVAESYGASGRMAKFFTPNNSRLRSSLSKFKHVNSFKVVFPIKSNKSQNSALQMGEELNKKQSKEIQNKILAEFSAKMSDLDRWEDSNPSLILFLPRKVHFSVKPISVSESGQLSQLVSSIEYYSDVFDTISSKGYYQVKNPLFRENDFHCEETEFLEIKISEPKKGPGRFKRMSSECLLYRLLSFINTKNPSFEDLIYRTRAFEGKGYEITLDNFLKISLIIQRTRLRIPVICMGETGCGKTYMIKYISKVLLRVHRFVHVTLHAGYSETHLQEFLQGIVLKTRIDQNCVATS